MMWLLIGKNKENIYHHMGINFVDQAEHITGIHRHVKPIGYMDILPLSTWTLVKVKFGFISNEIFLSAWTTINMDKCP